MERLSEYWYEFAQEAGTQVRKQVSRTANALAPHGQRKLVTVEGIVVPEQTLTDEMEKMGLVAGKAQRGAVNTLINYNVEKKTIQKWGQGNSTEVMIGLPGWDTPEEEQY